MVSTSTSYPFLDKTVNDDGYEQSKELVSQKKKPKKTNMQIVRVFFQGGRGSSTNTKVQRLPQASGKSCQLRAI